MRKPPPHNVRVYGSLFLGLGLRFYDFRYLYEPASGPASFSIPPVSTIPSMLGPAPWLSLPPLSADYEIPPLLTPFFDLLICIPRQVLSSLLLFTSPESCRSLVVPHSGSYTSSLFHPVFLCLLSLFPSRFLHVLLKLIQCPRTRLSLFG